jgi:hypothetical protein
MMEFTRTPRRTGRAGIPKSVFALHSRGQGWTSRTATISRRAGIKPRGVGNDYFKTITYRPRTAWTDSFSFPVMCAQVREKRCRMDKA